MLCYQPGDPAASNKAPAAFVHGQSRLLSEVGSFKICTKLLIVSERFLISLPRRSERLTTVYARLRKVRWRARDICGVHAIPRVGQNASWHNSDDLYAHLYAAGVAGAGYIPLCMHTPLLSRTYTREHSVFTKAFHKDQEQQSRMPFGLVTCSDLQEHLRY